MTRSIKSFRSTRAAVRRRQPAVEGLESRTLLSVYITDRYTTPGTPQAIVKGPDGNLWFTAFTPYPGGGIPLSNPSVNRLNPTTGVITSIPVNQKSHVNGIAVGPDGNLWFTESDGDFQVNQIGVINPTTLALGEYPIPTPESEPSGIVAGPDGQLWFTERGVGKVAEINPTTHFVTEYPLGRSDSTPTGITLGPDGNIWFTESASMPGSTAGQIGRINPTTKMVSEFPTPTPRAEPTAITAAPDGKLYFTETNRAIAVGIGVIDPSTTAIVEYPNTVPNTYITGHEITAGPDGRLYFNELEQSNGLPLVTLGEFDPATHAFASYPNAQGGTTIQPGGVVTGPDGRLWFGGGTTIDRAFVVPANQSVITSNVYSDPLGDGTYSGGPLTGRLVYLDLNHDGSLDPGDPTAITDTQGNYSFLGITPGTYTIRLLTYPGDLATGPSGASRVVTVAGGQVATVQTFSVFIASAVLPLTFNPAPFGSHNPDVSTAEVNGLYQIILGRAPDPAGGAAAVNALKQGTSLALLASGLLHSVGYMQLVVAADFRAYLHVDVSADVIAAGVHALQSGWTEEQLAAYILDSADYNQIHASDTSFVTAAWRDVKGREANPDEVTIITGLLARGTTRAEVIDALLSSDEARRRAIDGMYQTFLGRQADEGGVQYWLSYLNKGVTLLDMAAGFANFSGFIARANATVG